MKYTRKRLNQKGRKKGKPTLQANAQKNSRKAGCVTPNSEKDPFLWNERKASRQLRARAPIYRCLKLALRLLQDGGEWALPM